MRLRAMANCDAYVFPKSIAGSLVTKVTDAPVSRRIGDELIFGVRWRSSRRIRRDVWAAVVRNTYSDTDQEE